MSPLTAVLGAQSEPRRLARQFAHREPAGGRRRRVRRHDGHVGRRRAEVAGGVLGAHGERVGALRGERDGRALPVHDADGRAVLVEHVARERAGGDAAGLPGERGRGVGHAFSGNQWRATGRRVRRAQAERCAARALVFARVDRADGDRIAVRIGQVREAHRAARRLAYEPAVAVDAVAGDPRAAGFARHPHDRGALF